MSGTVRSLLTSMAAVVATVGVAGAVLLMPWFTRLGIVVSGAPALAELGRPAAAEAAEAARRYVAGRADALPPLVSGSPGFDEASVAHLADVRRVVSVVRWIAIAAVVGLLSLAAHAVAHGTQQELARGLRWAGWALIGIAAALGFLGALDFRSAFVAFHEALFPQGGWIFPDDALLIQLFPERFWALAGGSLLVLMAVGGWAMLLIARFVRTLLSARPRPSAEQPLGD